ncbi:MAG: TonB family protein [Acidobacteriota bacterium]
MPGLSGGRRAQPPSVPVPELEREIFAMERSDRARAFPVERAILFSLALHIIILILMLYGPSSSAGTHSLFPGMTARPRSEEDKIPIVFRAAPGPERPRDARKPADFSDKNRRAGGGDRSRPRADTPFAPVLPGREGLAPGSASRTAAAPSGARGGQSRNGQSGAPAERSATGMTPPDVLRNPSGSSSGAGAATGTGSSASRLANLDTVIQEAARTQVGKPGEHGAGIPNPDGGFMDSGPLSFETSWYDWGPYADEMVRRIKLHWDVPKLAELGWKGKLTIHFDIRADGSVSGASIVAGSGIPPFDFAAMQAILKSNPFKPLPRDLLKEVPGKDREGVTVTFFYNMRPGKNPTSEGM